MARTTRPSPSQLITPEHLAARKRRAGLLADAIEHVGGTPEGAAKLPITGWKLAVEQARVLNPTERISADFCPHWHTRQLTIRILRDRRELRLAPADQPDPFAGLPS